MLSWFDRRSFDPRSRQRGFTLVEILVTLAIIVLMATLFLPRMSKSPSQAQPEIVKFLNGLAGEAVRTRTPVSVELHGQVLRSSNGKEFRLAEGERLHSARRPELSYLGGYHIVTFFTDGSSTAGEWLLSSGSITLAIRFSPFASRIGYTAVTAATEGG